MTVKKKWTVIPAFLALAAAASLLSAYSGASSSQGLRVEQPVKFVHAPHVAKAGMNCLYCHSAANKSPDPGNAAVSTCMGCHLIVKPQAPEIKKVAAFDKIKRHISGVVVLKYLVHADNIGVVQFGEAARFLNKEAHQIASLIRLQRRRLGNHF